MTRRFTIRRLLLSVLSISILIVLFGLMQWTPKISMNVEKQFIDDDDGNDVKNLFLKQDSGTIGVSGSVFAGNRIRQFGDHKRKFRFISKGFENVALQRDVSRVGKNGRSCTRWAVVTTIHEPSESVRRMLYLINKPRSDWCMVIVGDLDLPSDYEIPSTLANHKNVVFLNSKEQKKIVLDSELHSIYGSAFVESMPWHSFGRKNVGFAYALAQHPTPKFVWDFDDDNQLRFWIDNANIKKLHTLDNVINVLSSSRKIEVISVNRSSYLHTLQTSTTVEDDDDDEMDEPSSSKPDHDVAFNPYPAMGCPLVKCWPRGIPLSQVDQTDPSTVTSHQNSDSWLLSRFVNPESISIVQSLADHKPDVDAVFRLIVSNRPFSFTQATKGVKKIDKLLVVPKGLVVPMNAQATLHAKSAFFGLYLPWTVNGRVADIWRSYIAEAILSLTDHSVAFAPLPLVDQDRNTDHGPMADFEAESQLYMQIDALIQRLYEWKVKQENYFLRSVKSLKLAPAEYFTKNLAALMEDLYIDLYERQFVEEDDVKSVQHWLKLLTCYGYLHSDEPVDCHDPSWNVGIQPVISSEKLERFAQIGNSQSDYTTSTCPDVSSTYSKTDISKLTFLNVDLHNRSLIDKSTMLASLGIKTILAGNMGKKTPYPNVLTRAYSASKKTSLIEVSDMRSDVINRYSTHNAPLNDHDIQQNFDFYTHQGQGLIEKIDVFTSHFPPAMFQIWNHFLLPENQVRTRSVVIGADHRYNIGRCSVREWRKLNKDIKRLLSSSSGKHAVSGSSRYDLEYLYHYTGINTATNGYIPKNMDTHFHDSQQNALLFLSAMSHFYTRPEVGQDFGVVKKKDTLLTISLYNRTFANEIKRIFDKLENQKVYMTNEIFTHKQYSLSDLTQYTAILFYPSSVMSYKFTEFYSLNIPLMVPSMKYYREVAPFGLDRSSTGLLYCNNERLGLDMPKAPNSVHQYNPNVMSTTTFNHNETDPINENLQHELYWLQFSDFYDWPHVTYFDNVTHAADLFTELAKKDGGEYFHNIRRLMEAENKMRRYFAIEKNWCPLLGDISRSIHGSK